MKIEKSKLMKSQIKEVVQLKTDRSFTSIKMVHTHTRLAAARLLFVICGMVRKALIVPTAQDASMCRFNR